jgi:ketosteroid isomerase-like protein
MRTLHFLSVIVFVVPSLVRAQNATPEARAIRVVLDKQVVDWNRGDLDAFATGYKNSPDILFIGSKISHGYAQMVDTYRKNYATKEKMGTLNFSELEVQPLDEHFATVTGHFHLERTAAGGGDSDGHFLLVFEKTQDGWKVVRDDTTVPAKKACD